MPSGVGFTPRYTQQSTPYQFIFALNIQFIQNNGLSCTEKMKLVITSLPGVIECSVRRDRMSYNKIIFIDI